MSDEPTKAWIPDVGSRIAVLRAEVSAPGVDHVELEVRESPVLCHLGVEVGGSVWMRIGCDPKTVVPDDQAASVRFDLTSGGYKVTVAPTAEPTVVDHLMEEMVQLLGAGHEPGEVGHAALQSWRDLLARPAGQPLSESALVGLFGELEVLEMILNRGGHLDHWTGWDRDRNDFRLPGLVIEVKSTISSNYRRVRVHGLNQLASPEDGSELILVLKRLEPSPEGRNVPEMVEQLVRLGASRSVILDRLSQLRYFEQHREHYERSRFVSREVALRRIDESHPRLVPEMLAEVDLSCVDKIDYELNLNGVGDADLETELETIVAGHLGGG